MFISQISMWICILLLTVNAFTIPNVEELSKSIELLIREKNGIEPHKADIYVKLFGKDQFDQLRPILKHIHKKLSTSNTFTFYVDLIRRGSWKNPKFSLYIVFIDDLHKFEREIKYDKNISPRLISPSLHFLIIPLFVTNVEDLEFFGNHLKMNLNIAFLITNNETQKIDLILHHHHKHPKLLSERTFKLQ